MNRGNIGYILLLTTFTVVLSLYLTFSIALYPRAQSDPSNPTKQSQLVNTVVQMRFFQTAEAQALQSAMPPLETLIASSTLTPNVAHVLETSTARVQTSIARVTFTQAALPALDLTATAVMEVTVEHVLKQDLTSTAMPVGLVSEKYLDDTSLLSQKPCGVPCFSGVVVGVTSFADAQAIINSDPTFSNVQTGDNPLRVIWSTAAGEQCCYLTADENTKIVDSIVLKLRPAITTQQVIDKYGTPAYTFPVDYSNQEVTVAIVFPTVGLIIWTVPDNPLRVMKETDPVVIVLYFDPKTWDTKYLPIGMLDKWDGYQPYQVYREATPVVTPKYTPTLP